MPRRGLGLEGVQLVLGHGDQLGAAADRVAVGRRAGDLRIGAVVPLLAPPQEMDGLLPDGQEVLLLGVELGRRFLEVGIERLLSGFKHRPGLPAGVLEPFSLGDLRLAGAEHNLAADAVVLVLGGAVVRLESGDNRATHRGVFGLGIGPLPLVPVGGLLPGLVVLTLGRLLLRVDGGHEVHVGRGPLGNKALEGNQQLRGLVRLEGFGHFSSPGVYAWDVVLEETRPHHCPVYGVPAASAVAAPKGAPIQISLACPRPQA